ncbi:MAG: 3-hydroxyacyl-CoA dehydrogenase family protein, partial [Kocuria sp.]|nr:3-hydroxyacyl-CoA dehydrogenase family protein [Kocuria sp.]
MSEETKGTVPAKVGVLGGGRMGAGIAHAFLISGAKVTVVEANPQAAQGAKERVESDLAKSLERGKIDGNLDAWAENFTVSLDHADFSECELVIEAVPEIWDLKVSSLQQVEANLSESAWLATNTSSLSVDGLAAELKRPERFCGLHFFNPVPASKLVEIVIGQQTSDELQKLTLEWVAGIGKTPVTVNDAPGFASSRLGVALGLEAIRMVEEGVASAEDIDNAMV